MLEHEPLEHEPLEHEPLEQEDLALEEEVRPDRALTLREIFGDKLIHFGSMNRTTRFIAGLGIAQIIVAALLMGLNLLHFPEIAVHAPDGKVSFSVPVPILVACLVFMISAWTWLLVGALHSRPLLRVPVLGLFYVLHIMLLTGTGSLTGWALLLLSAVYAVWHGIKRPTGYSRDLAILGTGVALLYGLLTVEMLREVPSGELVTTLLSRQIFMTTLLLLPLLVIAGLDLGESVRDMIRWIIGQGAARSGSRALYGVAMVLLLAKLIALIVLKDASWGWLPAGFFVLTAGYLAVRMKPWEGMHHEPPFGLVFLLVIVGVVATIGYAVGAVLAGRPMSDPSGMWWTWGLPGTVGAVTAVILARRQQGADRRTAVTFLTLFALWALVRWLAASAVWGLPLKMGLPELDGVLTLLLPACLFLLDKKGLANRSVSAWAVSLTVGLSVIRLMVWMVQNDFDVPAAAAALQVLILAIGLLWDVLTSGDNWTNGHSRQVPRAARVLLYFGYVGVTVTAILFFKSTGQVGTFNEDDFAVMGVLLLGVPIYLYGFVRAGVMLVHQAIRERGAA